MASSAEMLAGAIALIVWTFIEYVLYIMGSAIIGPLINIVNQFKITPLLGMSDNSYIFYIFYGMLLIFEIMAIIAFGYIVMRRQVSGTEYL